MHPLTPLKVANGVGNSLNVRWGTSLECISQATVIHVVGFLPACVGSEAIDAVLGKSWRWMDYCVLCPVPFHSDEIKPDRKQRFGYSCPKLQCSILKLWYLHINSRNGTGAGCAAELHQSGIVGTPWDRCEEACKGEHLFQCDYSSQGNLVLGSIRKCGPPGYCHLCASQRAHRTKFAVLFLFPGCYLILMMFSWNYYWNSIAAGVVIHTLC